MIPTLSSHQISTWFTTEHNSLSLTEGDRRVIHLCPRGRALRPDQGLVSWYAMGGSPVAGTERYERGSESEEDYGHRMLVNLLAAVVLLTLILVGTWIVDTIVQTTQEGYNITRTVRDTSALEIGTAPLILSAIQHAGI
jgi:hypothetical protein